VTWTGNVPPRRLVIKTEYEHGKFVRELSTAYSVGGGMTITEIRCTCAYPEAGCTLHAKAPEPTS
jgi:hypothetical protein